MIRNVLFNIVSTCSFVDGKATLRHLASNAGTTNACTKQTVSAETVMKHFCADHQSHRHRVHATQKYQFTHLVAWWSSGPVRTSDLGLSVEGSIPSHDTARLFLR